MQTTTTTSIHKVRRDALGGKRGDGHLHLGEKIRRPDPGRIRVAGSDPTLRIPPIVIAQIGAS
jgi:hypothetical protein